MTGSVRCPNSTIAAPLAGSAEALEAANSPSPVATIIARTVFHIFVLLSDLPQLAVQRSSRMYLPGVAIKRVEGARHKDMHPLAGSCTRPRGKADKWPTSMWTHLMLYVAV